jgi:PAS domain-containing protein
LPSYLHLVELQKTFSKQVTVLHNHFDALNIAAVSWRHAGRLSMVSAMFAHLLGYTPGEMMLTYIFEYMAAEDVFPVSMWHRLFQEAAIGT